MVWPVVAMALPPFLLLHAGALHRAFCGRGVQWWVTGGQVALTYLPMPVVGPAWAPMCGLLAGAVFMSADRRRSPLILVAACACGP
ncbi:hypothetical protein C1I98_10350, partial [Spongiactinospora gelatinilytica]